MREWVEGKQKVECKMNEEGEGGKMKSERGCREEEKGIAKEERRNRR